MAGAGAAVNRAFPSSRQEVMIRINAKGEPSGGTPNEGEDAMIPRTLACLALLIAGTVGASAQDYRAEIMEHVVDRCYRATVHFHAMVRAPDSPNVAGEDELVRILVAAPHTEHLLAALTRTVRGKDREQRMNLYDVAFVNCFVSGSEDIL